MAEITLADYTGYLVREVVKARQMVDDYSRTVALEYAKDPVLQHFPAPRFRLPKVELNIPVLVAGTRYSRAVRFSMDRETFARAVQARLDDVVRRIRVAPGGRARPAKGTTPSRRGRAAAGSPATTSAIHELHRLLAENPDPQHFAGIVATTCPRLFQLVLTENQLGDVYKRLHPRNELLDDTMGEVRAIVAGATVVDRTRIDSLLIDPETAAVKNGSNDSSVFTIKAELVEESIRIKSVRDERSGETQSVVDFD